MDRLARALLLGLLVWAGACAPRPPATPELEDLNVLLVVVDTLGARHVGHLRPGLDHTPTLDRLAREGVTFRRAYSPAPWTQPAMASLLTSQMPSSHGLLRLFDTLPGERTTLPELLQERGFATAAVVSHFLLGRRYGFGAGFQIFDAEASASHVGVTSAAVTARALHLLDELVDADRFFLLVHYFDPHYVYHHHPAYDRTSGYTGALRPGMDIWMLRGLRPRLAPEDVDYLVGLYREEIAFTDAHVARLLERLDALDLTDRTLVVVTADHGEEFMEHGWIGHTRSLYDELLRVPLVMRLPGVLAPRGVDAPVSLLDVVPTLMEISRRAADVSKWEGRSLWPLLRGEAETAGERDLFAEVSFAVRSEAPGFMAQKEAFQTALLRGDLKVVHDLVAGTWELYDRGRDPAERDDRFGEHPRSEDLRSGLRAWEEARDPRMVPRVEPGEDELERLRALGYAE